MIKKNFILNIKKTPAFIYDLSVIRTQINKILKAFEEYKDFELLYSMKANNSNKILEVIKNLNIGIAVSSEDELSKAKELGFEKISYTAPYIPNKLLETKTIEINFNNFSEVKNKKNSGLRINPLIGWSYLDDTEAGEINSQFGIPINELNDNDLTNVERLHMHTSSDSYKIDLFIKSLRKLLELIKNYPQIKTINIGGGIAIPICEDAEEFDIQNFAKKIIQEMQDFNNKFGRKIKLQFEPGNYVVRPAGYYVCRVMAKEIKFGKEYYFTDGTKRHIKGINNFKNIQYSRNLKNKSESYLIGKTCQRGDVLYHGLIPELNIGDLIIIPNTGAYCSVQADNFHLIPKSKELFF